jgi:hypothetical protein
MATSPHDCPECSREIADVVHLWQSNSILETVHAREEVDEVVHPDVERFEHRSGGCAIHDLAYDGACASGTSANNLCCCMEFDGDLYGR